jgi:hypothetical protein
MKQHVFDVVERAVKAGLWTFLTVWSLSSFSMTKDVLMGAVGASMSAVFNTAVKVEAVKGKATVAPVVVTPTVAGMQVQVTPRVPTPAVEPVVAPPAA